MRKLPKDEKLTQRVIQVAQPMWRAVRAAAREEGVSMSEWVRRAIGDRLAA